jgi:hypothetical protein
MAKASNSNRTSSLHDPLPRRIGDLKRERAELEEEVLQLRAAVQIWTAVCRQTMAVGAGSRSLDAEMR